ncbi:transcriptional regulator [Streptomyces sp. NPDC087294]|uniref:transcriptional regulator n=1 Tax=Streptomyces sp. NPDC087294 TaxID=3365777 RepID=UPI0038106F76
MPERTIDFGKFGARGVRAFEAVAVRLDGLVGFVSSPVSSRRGLLARLRYLRRSGRAWEAARAAGLMVTDRTVKAWLEGKRSPSKVNLERIEVAYRAVRRRNVARYLVGRLNREGRGTRVEFHPLNQSQVARPFQRVLEFRTVNVRRWDRIVEAWVRGDMGALDEAWVDDVAVDLGSSWGQYDYVSAIGFAA